MPFRSLKEADLKPLVARNLRTVPRSALGLTLAAQVTLWGGFYVFSFTVLRSFEKVTERLDFALTGPVSMLVSTGQWIRQYRWAALAVLLLLLSIEIFYFYKSRPFVVKRKVWLLLMTMTLVLPFLLSLGGGLHLLIEGLRIFRALRG